LNVRWTWSDGAFPDLLFSWPVRGLRWRIQGMGDELASWSRQMLQIDRRRIPATDAQLEIHLPATSPPYINGISLTDQLQDGPCGQRALLGLMRFHQADVIRLMERGDTHEVVLLLQNPVLDRFAVEADGESVVVRWAPVQQSERLVLLAWNGLRPQSAPSVI